MAERVRVKTFLVRKPSQFLYLLCPVLKGCYMETAGKNLSLRVDWGVDSFMEARPISGYWS